MTRLTDAQIAEMGGVQRRAATSNRNLNDRADGIRSNLEARALIDTLADMNKQKPQLKTLPKEEPKGGIPSRRGYAERNSQPGYGEKTGGIASPLIEGASAPLPPEDSPDEDVSGTPKLEREYWPDGVMSSDGLFMLPALKKLTMRDANGAKVVIELADPSVETDATP
ncbi:MAG: hypothetical protein ACRBBM_10975 [Pseudomonadaceae bacterium]|jgi:hypothetical protein